MRDFDISVSIRKLDPAVETPTYAYEGDAGLDLASSKAISLDPFQRTLIPTGISISLPSGYAGFLLPRSGMASKYGLTLVNSPGLIDSHYRGEILIAAINLDSRDVIHINRGDRIAQLVIMPVPHISLHVVDQLDTTDRGSSGFGSSGTLGASL